MRKQRETAKRVLRKAKHRVREKKSEKAIKVSKVKVRRKSYFPFEPNMKI